MEIAEGLRVRPKQGTAFDQRPWDVAEISDGLVRLIPAGKVTDRSSAEEFVPVENFWKVFDADGEHVVFPRPEE